MENVELTEDGKFNCPVCGKTLFDSENPVETITCPHLQMLFTSLAGVFCFVAPGMRRVAKQIERKIAREEFDGDMEALLEWVAGEHEHTVYAITTSGMACGPVSNTDYYVISKRQLDEDDCPHCGGRNTEVLEGKEHECYDCGKSYTPSRKAKKGLGSLKDMFSKVAILSKVHESWERQKAKGGKR